MPMHIKKGSKRHNYCDVQTAVQRHKERCPRSSTGPRCPAKSGITPPTSQPRREPSAFKSEQSKLILSTGHQDSTVLPCAHQPGACGARCSASMPMLMWELEPHVVCVPLCRQSVLRTLPRHTASTPLPAPTSLLSYCPHLTCSSSSYNSGQHSAYENKHPEQPCPLFWKVSFT